MIKDKMKYSLPVALCIFLASCQEQEILRDSSLQASLDFANTHVHGPSPVSYSDFDKMNYIDYYPRMLTFGLPGDNSVETNQDDHFIYDKKPDQYFSIGSGLEFIGKGAKLQAGGGTIALNYLEIPIDALYHYTFGPGSLYGGLGPYFAYGIGGKSIIGGYSQSSFSNGNFYRFDAGIGFRLAYQLDMGIVFGLSYDLGLVNTAYSDQGAEYNNRCFSINAGYQIGRLFTKK
jgi:hypothetical protein